MPRFQSRLFNWIDQSLPAKLGRRARQMFDRQFDQISNIQELPRLLAYQVAKAALYPVYLIASTAKQRFPALNRSKADTGDDTERNLRSQPDSGGLLPEADAIAESVDKGLEPVIEQNLPLEIPLFLRPLVKFLSWIDRTKINLDRNINAIIKRQPDNLATSISSEPNSELNSELASRLLANRMFAEIWQQRLGHGGAAQGESEQNSLRENNGLSENVALGKNTRLEQLRRLIEAAIAYFFGNQSDIDDDNLIDDQDLSGDLSLKNTETSESVKGVIDGAINGAISDSPQLRRKKIKAANSQKDQLQKNSSQIPASSRKSGDIKVNAPLAQNSNLERLRELIAAAIDYFIGKRSLSGDSNETSDITPSKAAWLTMEEVFGDDNGPWPLPLEYESHAFAKSPDMGVINSSGELQNFETTTTQISQDRLEGGLLFGGEFEEELLYQEQNTGADSDRPLRAWIEANATILGYTYNPVMTVILWIDAIVLKLENGFIALWRAVVNFPKRLLHFIRYGSK